MPSLLNLGSFEFHTVHGALYTGEKATNWEVNKELKAVWTISSDSPARRELFTKTGEANSFPLRFESIFIGIHRILDFLSQCHNFR